MSFQVAKAKMGVSIAQLTESESSESRQCFEEDTLLVQNKTAQVRGLGRNRTHTAWGSLT